MHPNILHCTKTNKSREKQANGDCSKKVEHIKTKETASQSSFVRLYVNRFYKWFVCMELLDTETLDQNWTTE